MVMSIFAPGSAQLVAGSRRVGLIALPIWFVTLLGVGLTVWLVPMDQLARLAVRPWVLTSFKVFAFTFAAAWVLLILDAWRLGRPPTLNRKHRLVMVAATLIVASMISAPFVAATRVATAAHDAVVDVFPSGEVAAASDGRLNFLLLGADAGDGRSGVRPDSINLVSIDVRSGTPLMISLPRNLEKARFPADTPAAEEFPSGFEGGENADPSEYFLNATWTYGEANPELFPGPSGPGPTAVKQAVEGTLGVPVHYYVAVDMMGFRELVDALGGVSIEVGKEIPIGEKGRVLEPGPQTLDGYEALWYARSREGSSDYARMERQRCVIGAIAESADPQAVLGNFRELTEASTSMLQTDIPREVLPDLVNLALKAKQQEVSSLQLVPPLIAPGDPDFEVIADEVGNALDLAVGETPIVENETAAASSSGESESAADPSPTEQGDEPDEDPQEAEQPAESEGSDESDQSDQSDESDEGDQSDEGEGEEQDDQGDQNDEDGGDEQDEPTVGLSSVCSYA